MKLFVGNIDYSVTEPELVELFSAHGLPDQLKIVKDRTTGQSKGYGFVEFEDEIAAVKSMMDLNETSFHNRQIVVREAGKKER